MTRFGLTLLSELHTPRELIEEAVGAEQAGFEFLAHSDHFLPWLDSHGHSPFAWTSLGAIAQATHRIDLATMVTCPFVRYHPAIIAQAAVTVAALSDGRFTLGLGAGERLNEHVVGRGWPAVDVRHEMLSDSIDIITALFAGEMVTHRGAHLTAEDAQLFDAPEPPPNIFIGVSGPQTVDLALEKMAGICAVEPLPDLIDRYRQGGGDPANTWAQLPVAWDDDTDRAKKQAHERFRFGIPGWKVMSELPNIVNFEAAASTVRVEDVAEQVPCGNDPEAVADALRHYIDAGYENIAVVQLGDDRTGFLDAWPTITAGLR